jgi:hypothetical protein
MMSGAIPMMVRTLISSIAFAAVPAFADVDCHQIIEDLKAGRTPQGVVNGHRIKATAFACVHRAKRA